VSPRQARIGPIHHRAATVVGAFIAAQFAVVLLSRQTRSVSTGVIVAIGAVFVAMKTRVAWFAATPWTRSDDLRAASGIALSIDRYAFWFALIAGIAGWVHIDRRRVPSTLDPAYQKQLRRCFLVCMAASYALGVTVACDGVLTAFRLIGTEYSIDYLIAIVSMAIELGCAGALALQLRRMMRGCPGKKLRFATNTWYDRASCAHWVSGLRNVCAIFFRRSLCRFTSPRLRGEVGA
jgi:hypothetical protein